MLTMPANASAIVPIIGLDPGSDTLGTGTIWYNLDTDSIERTEAKTFVGSRMARESWDTGIHGDRLGRIFWHESNLLRMFQIAQPFSIASESPFFAMRRPQAYGALMEVVTAIRNAVRAYDAWKVLNLIDPPTVKNAVGAKGNAQKDEVKQKLLGLPNLNYVGEVPLHLLDEHSVDAVAVAYCQLQRLLENQCLPKRSSQSRPA